MRGEGVLLSWTDAYRHAAYDGQTGPPISALKSFILSPWTDLAAVDLVARQVLEAREQLATEPASGKRQDLKNAQVPYGRLTKPLILLYQSGNKACLKSPFGTGKGFNIGGVRAVVRVIGV